MKKIVLVLLVMFQVKGFAKEVICDIKVNREHVFSTILEISKGQKVEFAEVAGSKFTLKSLKNSQYEIEIFDRDKSSRAYAEGSLKTKGERVQYSLWTRDILLESSCGLF